MDYIVNSNILFMEVIYMNFTKWFLVIVVLLPTILILLYGIIKPKESFLFGRRWQFKNDVEPSEFTLDMHRLFAIAILIVMFILLEVLIIS